MREPKKNDTPAEPPWTPEEIAELQRCGQGPGPFYFGQQVTDRLQALEHEWERTGGFDSEYMQAFLKQLDELDPPHYVARSRTV